MRLTQAVLPVAGLGTRFLPWTKAVPKELLPVGRMPVIAFLVDECLSVGIRDICFVISRGKESVPAFFQRDAALEEELRKRGKADLLSELARYDEVRFSHVYQNEQLGDGHAILQAKDWVDSDHVAVLFGDDIIVGGASGLQQLVRAGGGIRDKGKGIRDVVLLCLENVFREDVSKYGIADVGDSWGRLKVIRGLVEKPKPEEAPGTLGIVGKYVIPRSLFSVLPTVRAGLGGEIRLIDAFVEMLALNRSPERATGSGPIYGYAFEGRRFDVGTPEGYREAVAALG